MPFTKAIEIAVLKLHQSSYETLAARFVFGASLFGAFWVPSLFSFIVNQFGYSLARKIEGLLSLISIIQ